MRTTVDIPDSLYRQLRIRAAVQDTTIREIILSAVSAQLNPSTTPTGTSRPSLPILESAQPGSLTLAEEGVYEFVPFP